MIDNKKLPDNKIIYLGKDPFQTNHQPLEIEPMELKPLSDDFMKKWWAEQKKKTGREPGQSILKIGEDLTIQTSSTSRQVPQISGTIAPSMPDLEKQTSAKGNTILPELFGDRIKGERQYPHLRDSVSSFKPEDRPKVGRVVDETLKHVQETILSGLPNIPEEVRSVVSDFFSQSLETVRSDAKPLFQVEPPIEQKMVPIEDAAKQLGITDRAVRRIVQKGYVESTTQKVPINYEVDKTFVSIFIFFVICPMLHFFVICIIIGNYFGLG